LHGRSLERLRGVQPTKTTAQDHHPMLSFHNAPLNLLDAIFHSIGAYAIR
jgi:hypothetical protein